MARFASLARCGVRRPYRAHPCICVVCAGLAAGSAPSPWPHHPRGLPASGPFRGVWISPRCGRPQGVLRHGRRAVVSCAFRCNPPGCPVKEGFIAHVVEPAEHAQPDARGQRNGRTPPIRRAGRGERGQDRRVVQAFLPVRQGRGQRHLLFQEVLEEGQLRAMVGTIHAWSQQDFEAAP